jgi:glycosyltransferase involved in cell wall biosynthesis
VPLISVIVPVCNGERHLRECLSSIRRQSLVDYELLLVDDGSTDATPGMLEEFAAAEPRAQLLQGPGLGTAGAARNVGLEHAKGDYLLFLDADDYFQRTMFEELYLRARASEADVVACKFLVFDDVSKDVTQKDWMLRVKQLPEVRPFSGRQAGDRLFFSFNPAAWNKLFRAEFVRTHGLRFQELRRMNDAYFTFMALALADRIDYVDRHLVTYRVANSSSLQASIHEDPLEFVQALDALRASLQARGLWGWAERTFADLALRTCYGNLKRQTGAAAFLEVFEGLRGGVLEQLGLVDPPDSDLLRPSLRAWRRNVLTQSPAEYLFARSQAAEQDASQKALDAKRAIQDAVAMQRPRAASAAPQHADEGAKDAPDVSVIIPVYNTLVFLDECIESVRRQTGCRVEIICIDDGSDDGSGDALDRHAAADSRIRVVHQANGGLSRARNRGVSMATGRYVCFLDSDDYWQDDSLADLVGRADSESLDVLLFDATCVREPGVDDQIWAKYEMYYARQAYLGDFDGPGLMAAMNAAGEYRASACLFLARRSHLVDTGLQFFPGLAHEDNLYTFTLLLQTQRAGHSKMAPYGRRVRSGSIVTAGSKVAAARGYFVTWVEMLRHLRDREFVDLDTTWQVGAVVQDIYAAARRSISRLPEEAMSQLVTADDGADAAALFLLLRRSRADDQMRRKLAKQLKAAKAAKKPPSVLRRLVRRLTRAFPSA